MRLIIPLHLRLGTLLLKKGKLTPRKLHNFFSLKYAKRRGYSTINNGPVLINFELWNECNEACVFCRSKTGDIYRSDSGEGFVPKGKARIDDVNKALDIFRNSLIFCVPYVNGEPLIASTLNPVLQKAKEYKIGTVIASNGISLSKEKGSMLIDADLDLLKVHISGMTDDVHQIQHRTGSAATILDRLREFKKLSGNQTLVVLDYILYNHNKHQLIDAKSFCNDNGITLNVRPGNNRGMEHTEQSNDPGLDLEWLPCDYVWEAFTLDWNRQVLPCCDFVTWPAHKGLIEDISSDSVDLMREWSQGSFARFRSEMLHKGRSFCEVCKNCPKTSLGFKF